MARFRVYLGLPFSLQLLGLRGPGFGAYSCCGFGSVQGGAERIEEACKEELCNYLTCPFERLGFQIPLGACFGVSSKACPQIRNA